MFGFNYFRIKSSGAVNWSKIRSKNPIFKQETRRIKGNA